MEASLATGIFWIMLTVVVLGVIGTAVARTHLTCPIRRCGRVFFFLCLLSVGLGTLAALIVGSSLWVAGGAMLALMAIGATWDAGHVRQSPAF
jgi:hypothetical protein